MEFEDFEMPPPEAKKRGPAANAKDKGRSKSADSRWKVVNKGFQSVSKSLPTLHKAKSKSDNKAAVQKDGGEKKKRRRKKKEEEVTVVSPDPPKPKIIIPKEDKRSKTLWRHMIWLVVLFGYSLLGGVIFSAIEGGNEKAFLVKKYESDMDLFKRRRMYQDLLFKRFRDIDRDKSVYYNRKGLSPDAYKLQLARAAFLWYEERLGVVIKEPVMKQTRWNLWGGVYYAASLYTTIGYGNFFPSTTHGRIISMIYAIIGIPLIFTILFDWGFLYFTWIEYGWNWVNERFCQKSLQKQVQKRHFRERVRRVGSEMSLGSMSAVPLIKHTSSNLVNTTDHQIESNAPLKDLDLVLPEGEQAQTVPLKAALLFFVFWISLSAFVVRLWEVEWTYFSAFYFFFTSLTTIGLGDVVTKTPNFIIFNLALTLVGLSVVGLCLAIVQAKVKLVFDRLIRSIEAQYRIKQIDPDVATMSLIAEETEGVKKLIEAQPLQDRIVFLFMDEHKKSMLRERWKVKSGMTNRITQTYPSKADKYVQTGNRVYDQPLNQDEGSEYDEDEDESESVDSAEYDEAGNKIIPPSTKRYIYTVFD